LKLKRGEPISSRDEDEFEVKGRETMRRFREAMEEEEKNQLAAKNRPIPVLLEGEKTYNPVYFGHLKKPTAATPAPAAEPAAPKSPVIAPTTPEAAVANAAVPSSPSLTPAKVAPSTRSPTITPVDHDPDLDDLPALIEQTLPVYLLIPYSPFCYCNYN
jgi:hypothetical protein